MIPSSSGRESEGQIATALSLSLSLSSSLYRSSYQPFPPPTFHSHSGTLAFILPPCLPLQPLSLHFCLPASFHFSPFCSVIFALSPPPLSFPILFSWLDILVSATHAHTHTHTHARARASARSCTHLSYTSPLCLRWWHQKHAHTSITSIFGFQAHTAKHTDIKIHTGYTTQVGQWNSIRLSAPDGSEESFQLINNLASTCIKLNRCLLVIMNVLMGLSDRSGPQAIGNSFTVCLFCFFLFSLSLRLQGPS